MKIKDKLLSDLLDNDRYYQKFVGEQLTEPSARKSSFVVVDVNDTYRALITNSGMHYVTYLEDSERVKDFNNTVKGLSVRFRQVPTHLEVSSDNMLDDYKSLVAKSHDHGYLSKDNLAQEVIDSASNDYVAIRTALGAQEYLPDQSLKQTQLQSKASKSAQNVRELTQRHLQQSVQREQARILDYENNRGASNGTIIGSLAAVTVGIALNKAGVNTDSESLQNAGMLLSGIGGLVGGVKALQQLKQSAHIALIEKSPWYSAKKDICESRAVKEMMSSFNADSISELKSNQLNAIHEVIAYSSPTASDAEINARLFEILEQDSVEPLQQNDNDLTEPRTLSRQQQ